MKLFGAVAMFGLLVAVPAIAADYGMPPDVERATKSQCAGRYPTDFSMQAACMRNQSRGYKDLGLDPYPTMETVKVDFAAEKAKAEVRVKTGYHDPNARVLDCGPSYRMTDRDGCQPR